MRFRPKVQKLDRIRMGYSSISSSRIALWVTNDMGFFQRKRSRGGNHRHAGSSRHAGAYRRRTSVLSWRRRFSGAGGCERVRPGRLGHRRADRIQTDHSAKCQNGQRFKRQKIVVDRVGGTSYYISLQILEKVGLKTGEVELVQVGGGGNQRVAAFKSGLFRALLRPLIDSNN